MARAEALVLPARLKERTAVRPLAAPRRRLFSLARRAQPPLHRQPPTNDGAKFLVASSGVEPRAAILTSAAANRRHRSGPVGVFGGHGAASFRLGDLVELEVGGLEGGDFALGILEPLDERGGVGGATTTRLRFASSLGLPVL